MNAKEVVRPSTDAGPAGESEHFSGDASCSGAESFALMVLGDSMLPEFESGDIVIIEPEGVARDGSYVLAYWNDEWLFRQLTRTGASWSLCALDASIQPIALPDLQAVRGVIIQKAKPGRRRASKRYLA